MHTHLKQIDQVIAFDEHENWSSKAPFSTSLAGVGFYDMDVHFYGSQFRDGSGDVE